MRCVGAYMGHLRRANSALFILVIRFGKKTSKLCPVDISWMESSHLHIKQIGYKSLLNRFCPCNPTAPSTFCYCWSCIFIDFLGIFWGAKPLRNVFVILGAFSPFFVFSCVSIYDLPIVFIREDKNVRTLFWNTRIDFLSSFGFMQLYVIW